MSYYDVDQILTEAEKVPCTFNIDSAELGYLDNNPSALLKSGTKLSLPLWLAKMLATSATASGDPFITMTTPPALSNDVIQALKADPRAVPVREQSPFFYQLAEKILELWDDPQMASIVRLAWIVRAAEVAVLARRTGEENAVGGEGPLGNEFMRGLENWERDFFSAVHDARKDVKEFEEKGSRE